MLILVPIGLVLAVATFSLLAGIAKDGSPLRRDFWTAH